MSTSADAITFTSSSTVRHVVDALGLDAPALLSRVVVASIGSLTTATADRLGVRVDVTAATPSTDALVDALARAMAAPAADPSAPPEPR